MIKWNKMKSWVAEANNEARRFLDTHKKNVFVYGAGIAGYWYLNYLSLNNVDVEGFIVTCVDDVDKNNIPGKLSVFSLDYVISNYKDYSIVIGSPKYKNEICNTLKEKCNSEDIYSFEGEIYFTFLHDLEAYRDYILKNWDRIERLYNRLADDKSRETLQAFIMGRISGNQDYFSDCMVSDQYYPTDVISLKDEEVLVECGANDGRTLCEFIEKVNNRYKHIYLFEPDKSCIKQIRNVISDKSVENIDLIEKAVWESRTKLKFIEDEKYGFGRITNLGADYYVETETIDNIVLIPPTFIKMDIEGAELNALKGGAESIKKYTPKLAVCVYHRVGDFLDIPEYISHVNGNYKLYLRHHNWAATETVLYAVPN